MADGSSSSVSGGMDMGRERLQSKNDYSYLGQDSQTSPLEDLGARLMDQFNQSNAQSNLLFGGPGYGGSFVPRGGTRPAGGGNPTIGGGPTTPPGGGGPTTPPVTQPGTPGPAQPGNPGGTPVQPRTTPPATAPGPGPQNSQAISDADLAELQRSIPSARRLPNGNITWDDRIPKSYGVQPRPGDGVDNGEDAAGIANRLRLIRNGTLTQGGAGGPGYGGPTGTGAAGVTAQGGPPIADPTTRQTYQQPGLQDPRDPFSGTLPPVSYDPTQGTPNATAEGPGMSAMTMSSGGDTGVDVPQESNPYSMLARGAQQENGDPLPGQPSTTDLEAMFPGMVQNGMVGGPLDPNEPRDPTAGGGGNAPPTGGTAPGGGGPSGSGGTGGTGPGGTGGSAPPQTFSPPYAAGMDPRYGRWNPGTGTYDMNVPLQDQSKWPVHDPNYNPMDPTWKYYTEQRGNTYVPLNPAQRNDEDFARTSPITPQGSNINDAWSTSPGWRPEAPTGGLYGGYTAMAGENYDPFENLQQSLAARAASGLQGGVDDPTVRVLMDSWADMYNNPGYSKTAKDAIGQEGMLAGRASADTNAGQIMSMARRTNNPMATYGALADVSRGESDALGSAARKNAIDFENAARSDKQAARVGYGNTIDSALGRTQAGLTQLGATNKQVTDRRQTGLTGMNDLYKQQQAGNDSLLKQLQSLYSTRREDNTQLGKTTGNGGLWAS